MPEAQQPNEEIIEKVCSYLRNWFQIDSYTGKIEIINGALSSTYNLHPDCYFRIINSRKNDGVYKYPLTTLNDETFEGAIIVMALPKSFISLLLRIEAYETKYSNNPLVFSPFTSESFGNYSRSGGIGSKDTNTDKSGTWQGAFGSELARWRKL